MRKNNKKRSKAKQPSQKKTEKSTNHQINDFNSNRNLIQQNFLRQKTGQAAPKKLDLKYIIEQARKFYEKGYDDDQAITIEKYAEDVLKSYPKTELVASNSNLMRHVVVKPGSIALTTYEKGLSIYSLDGYKLDLMGCDQSQDMYLEVDLSEDCQKIFSYKFSLKLEYFTFEPVQGFNFVQDLYECIEDSDEVSKIHGIQFCDRIGLLAMLVEFKSFICVVLMSLKKTKKMDDKFEGVGILERTEDASCVQVSKSGKSIFVGFDYQKRIVLDDQVDGQKNVVGAWDLKLMKVESLTKREGSSNRASIKIFKHNGDGKNFVLFSKIFSRSGKFHINLKSIGISHDLNWLVSLSKDGLVTIYSQDFSKNENQGTKLKVEAERNENITEYKTVQVLENQNIKATTAQISTSGKLLTIGHSNGEIHTFEQDSTRLRFQLLANCNSQTKPVKHSYFTHDETKLFYESRNGVLKAELVEELNRRKEIVNEGHHIKFEKHTSVDLVEFANQSRFIVISLRDTRGSGEDYTTHVLEKDESGCYSENFVLKGSTFTYAFSDDVLLMFIISYPGTLSLFTREGLGLQFKEQKCGVPDEEKPYMLVIPPGSWNLILSTYSKKILLYQYDRNKKTHVLLNSIEESLTQIVNALKISADSKILFFSSLDRTIRIAHQESQENRLSYQIKKVYHLEDVPTNIHLSNNNQLLAASLNNGSIHLFMRDPKDHENYIKMQKIKLMGQLGQWNLINLKLFNDDKYMVCHRLKHHFLNSETHSEILLFSLNENYAEQVDSYGLTHRFWVGDNFDCIAFIDQNKENEIKIANLQKDFDIPQTQDLCKIYYDSLKHRTGSSEVTKVLFELRKAISVYLTNQGKKEYSFDFKSTKKPEKLDQTPKNSMKLKDIGKLFFNTQETEYSAWDRIRDEMKIHSEFNLIIYAVLAQNIEFVKKCLEVYGYRPLYYPKGFDPFDEALKLNNIDLLDTFAEAMAINKNKKYLISRIDLDIFGRITRCSSFLLKRVVIEAFFVEPGICNTIPIHSYPFREGEDFVVYPMTGLMLTTELRTAIDRAMAERKKLPQAKVKCVAFRFAFDPCLYSDSAYKILRAFNTIPDELKTKNYQYLVRHLWDSNYWIMCLYSFLVLVTTILFSIYNAFYEDNLVVASFTVGFCVAMLLFELSSLVVDPKAYFESYYNYLDLYIYIARPIIVILSYNSVIDERENELVSAWVNLTILIAGFRTMGELRLFSSTRVLMAMISQVIHDMTAFIVITLTIILLFSMVAANIYKYDPERAVNTTKDFSMIMHHYYNVASGIWEDSVEDMRASELFNFYLSGLALFLLMINLLIAVISLTFDNFQGKRHLHDLKELYEVMIGHCHFSQSLKKLTFSVFGKKRMKISPKAESAAKSRCEEVQHSHFLYITREESEDQIEKSILRRFSQNQAQLDRLSEINQLQFKELKSLILTRMPAEPGLEVKIPFVEH